MEEKKFYKLCDKIEELPDDFTKGYYPTVEELENHKVQDNLEEYLPIILYISKNPYKDKYVENEEEYQKSVKYCRDLVSKFKLS